MKAKKSALTSDQKVMSQLMQTGRALVRCCQTREDVELIGRDKLTDKTWQGMEAKAQAKEVSIGEHLYQVMDKHDDVVRNEQIEELMSKYFDPLFLRPDGTKRPDDEAETLLDAFIITNSEEREREELKKAREVLRDMHKSKAGKPE